MSHVDLECGASVASDGESLCFSDADEGSCCSQFYSTYGGSCDDRSLALASDGEIGGVSESGRVSSVAGSGFSVDIENGVREIKVHLGKVERDCRICHLSLVDGANCESGVAIELGCSCKDDLSAAHKHCAETWFKIKGNKTCEICNAIATNLVDSNDFCARQTTAEVNSAATSAASAPAPTAASNRSCVNGPRFLNFLLACLVFAFVVSWLFHFNIPS